MRSNCLLVLSAALVGAPAAQTALVSEPVPFSAPTAGTSFGSVQVVHDTARGVLVAVHWTNFVERMTWEFDGGSWSLRDQRPPTLDSGLAYDPIRGRTVLQCGDGATWEWDGTSWTQVVQADDGPKITGAFLAFDGEKIVLFGGRGTYNGIYSQLTLSYDGVAWRIESPTLVPPHRFNAQMCYDPSRRVVVMMGNGAGEVHEWDGSDWRVAGPPPSGPYAVRDFSLAFHAKRGRVWRAGGSTTVVLPMGTPVVQPVLETHEWDGLSWTPVASLSTGASNPSGFTTLDGDAAILGGAPQIGVNGEVQSLVSLHPATFDVYGAGCAGTNGVPVLSSAPWAAAWTGDVTRLQLDGVPLATPFVVFAWALSNTADVFGPLPRDLSALGLTGCFQRTSSDLLELQPASGGVAAVALAIPGNPALSGFELFAQAIVPDAAANPFGATLSDAGRLVVGSR